MGVRSRARVILLATVLVAWPALTYAQEPVWSIGVRGGLLVGSSDPIALDPQTVVSFRRAAPLVSLDLIRTIDSATELFVSGSIPRLSVGAPNPVSGDGDGTLSPDGLQIGVNYRIRRQRDPDTRARQWPYVGLFIGGFERSGSSPISLPASVSAGSNTAPRSVALRFPGGWGIGVHGGYRYRFNEQFTLDVNVKWQHLGMVLGENASLAWNPILITGGVVVRLF